MKVLFALMAADFLGTLVFVAAMYFSPKLRNRVLTNARYLLNPDAGKIRSSLDSLNSRLVDLESPRVGDKRFNFYGQPEKPTRKPRLVHSARKPAKVITFKGLHRVK